ncbi:MAG: nicotinamide riboside transporter PnuC [Hyphomonadaceae bacterium]
MNVDPIELAATLVTLACVILGVKRSLWQFPVGIVGTAIFFVSVWQGQLYANAALQVFFVGVQFYGWWYWLNGADGRRPPIRSTDPRLITIACAGALVAAIAMSMIMTNWTPWATTIIEACTFTFSVVAQFLLDRKRVETWWVWIFVNVLSVYLYASAGKWLFTALYVFFFFNAFWGWWEWRKAMRAEAATGVKATA